MRAGGEGAGSAESGEPAISVGSGAQKGASLQLAERGRLVGGTPRALLVVFLSAPAPSRARTHSTWPF